LLGLVALSAAGSTRQEVEAVEAKVDKISEIQFLATMQPTDRNMTEEELAEALRKEAKRRIQIGLERSMQKLQRFKELAQRDFVKDAIKKMAWRNVSFSLENVDPKQFYGQCVRACYRVGFNRFENVDDVYQYCVKPHCQVDKDGKFHANYTGEETGTR